MFKLFSICSLIISMLFTGVTQSPINMAAISCPVNFELLNGTIMDNNKLIINAKKTVKKETPKKETKKTKKPTPSKTKTTTKKEQENNTINLAGTILGISNEATQERLDKKYKEFVNWGSQYTENKLVDGGSVYFAIHNDSYGHLLHKAKELTLKDINGNVKVYKKSETLGPFKWSENQEMSDELSEYLYGNKGDAIAIQTCVGPNSQFKVYIFR